MAGRIDQRWRGILGKVITAIACAALMGGWSVALLTPPSATAGTPEIEVWHRWSGANQEALQAVIKEFQQKNAAITVKEMGMPGEYVELLQKMIANLAAGKQPPDILIGGYDFLNYIADELKPIPMDVLGGNEAKEVFGRFEPAVLKLGQVGGKQVGMPYAMSNIVTFYNPDLFKAAGLNSTAMPKTWTEMFTLGKVLREKTGKFPVHIQDVSNWTDQALIFSNGGRYLSDNGKCVAFNNVEAVNALDMWARLHAQGLSPKGTDAEMTASFTAGGIGMYVASIMKLSSLRQNSKFDIGVAPFPAFEGKKPALPIGGAALFVFSKESAKQKAAWELVKYFLSDGGLRTWTKTGYLGPTKAKMEVAKGQEVAYAQLPNSVPWLSWPGAGKGMEVDRIFLNTRNKIRFGETGAKEGLERAAQQSNALLGCK